MRNWIRRYLGLTRHDDEFMAIRLLMATKVDVSKIAEQLAALRSELTVTFGADEFDPKRRAMSDLIGEKFKARLLAEENARRHTEGRPLLDHLP